MPIPEGEGGIEGMSVDVKPKELLESRDEDDPTSKLPVSDPGFGKSSRINAKRKPDKSKIFRIRTNALEESTLHCDKCSHEFDSEEEHGDHEKSCRMSNILVKTASELNNPDVLKRHQDEANNNQANLMKSPTRVATPNSRELSPVRSNGYDSDNNQFEPATNPFAQIRRYLEQSSSQMPIAQQLAQSNMALEAIQNTRLALAQLASNALGNGQPASPQAAQEMAILQNTLYTLQHQQMMQLQLIQQLQAQLSIKNKEGCVNNVEDENSSEERGDMVRDHRKKSSSPIPNASMETSDISRKVPGTSSFITSLMERFKTQVNDSLNDKAIPTLPSEPHISIDTEEKLPSPPRIASNIASSVIQHTDPPPSDEPNTLEMLQRTANQVLNNASQGLLTNRLIDDYNKPPEGKDSYYKHRCRYCGKVFGSDSALQIHVRSHTGERPFKCNICGNRFTTKGNLKVHFQRHSARFPLVKMNPHPVPEHLDKLHPPLLAQLGELKDYPSPPTGPPNPFSSPPTLGPPLPPFRLPVPMPPLSDLHKSFNLNTSDHPHRDRSRSESEEPENLSAKSDTRNSFESERNEVNIESFNMDTDEIDPSGEEHIKVEPDIPSNEGSDGNESDRTESDQRYLNFRDPLHEVFRNNLREPFAEKVQESLRNSIHERLKESFKDSFREKLENSSLNDEQLSPPKPPKDLFIDSLSDPTKEVLKNHLKEIVKDDSQDKTSGDREKSAGTPNEIRIRTERELKETSDTDKSLKENNMDTDSGDSRSETSEQPTDLRIRQEFRPLGFPNMPYPAHRLPLNFPFIPGLPSPFSMSSVPPTPASMTPNMNITRDPNVYSNLLPRPGSTDNSWEALIEVTKTSETMKLEQLVNNIEHKLSDPNQCFICHRVLSCKSALQMHYRTHTGERPFKCKLCGRAFTTKGNLKTHMGVHRAKPPMRMLHQCPVCHKKFTNALVLQQHIRLHTGEPTDLTPEQIAAAEVRDYLPGFPIHSSMPHLLPGGFPLGSQSLPGFPPIPLHLRYQLSPEILRRYESEMEERRDEEEKYLRLLNNSSRSSSTGSVEQRNAEDLSLRMREEAMNEANSPQQSVSPTPSDYSDLGDQSHDGQMEAHHNFMERLMSTPISQSITSINPENIPPSTTPLDLTPRPPPPLFSPFRLFPPPPLTSASSSPGSQTMSNMSPLYSMANIPGRGNTTCHMCFKIFACQSALEIHYRSHTKERPYKCNVCDRGFTTKQGNMKQHMLTHKIRDANGERSENSNSSSTGDKASPDAKTTVGNATKNEDSIEIEESAEPTKEGENGNKRDDSGPKREREGELSLPVPKRQSALQEDAPNSEEDPMIHDEPPVLSPEVPIRRPFSPGRKTLASPNNSLSPPSSLPFQSSFRLPSVLHIPSSLSLPPSLSLPSSLAFSSPLSLPMCPPVSLGLGSAQPLPHS